MNKKATRDRRLLVANDMPPLFHTQPGKKYNYDDDDVLKWIAARPGLLGFVFDKLRAYGCISYDPDTGKWQGADYEP